MAKIFVNYRRDDVPGDSRGVRDGLAAKFGKPSVFMDVDNLLAGQRFDIELGKALDACDVLIAVIGPRWMDLFTARMQSGDRDYVREEIAAALARKIVVIPVRVGREGQMPPLPRSESLPEDIRELVLYQKHDVAHERFGRDIADLVQAIVTVRRTERPQANLAQRAPWGAAVATIALASGYVGAHYAGIPVPWPWSASVIVANDPPAERGRTAQAAEAKRVIAEQLQRKADDAERQRHADAAAQTKREQEARQRADAEVANKAKAQEAERQRLIMEAKRKADEEAELRFPSFRDCSDVYVCPEMVVVPDGRFRMGSSKSNMTEVRPTHEVVIAKPFAIGRFTVTFANWDACVTDGGCRHKPEDRGWGRGKQPVIYVSWEDVSNEYLPWLSLKTGKNYRFPTEAEWEYAARAGSPTEYPWGDDIGKGNANCRDCVSDWAGKQTAPVGSFKANAFGLHDMHGNVWQWVEDKFHSNYQGAPVDGSAWTTGGSSNL